MGHGGLGKWYLANAYYGQSSGEEVFNAADVGTAWADQPAYITTSKWDYEIEWVFFNMCSVLTNNDTYLVPWAKTMLGDQRVHSLFG